MAKVFHPFFGTIDPATSDCCDTTVAVSGRTVTVDLTFDDPDQDEGALDGLPRTSAALEELDRLARDAIVRDAQSGENDSAGALYITHHYSEFGADEFERLFGLASPDLANALEMLARLVLVRIGLYPEQQDRQVLFDYSIDSDATNYLICVAFDSGGQLVSVDMES